MPFGCGFNIGIHNSGNSAVLSAAFIVFQLGDLFPSETVILDVVLILGSIIPIILLLSECSFHCLPVGRLISKLNSNNSQLCDCQIWYSIVLNS